MPRIVETPKGMVLQQRCLSLRPGQKGRVIKDSEVRKSNNCAEDRTMHQLLGTAVSRQRPNGAQVAWSLHG